MNQIPSISSLFETMANDFRNLLNISANPLKKSLNAITGVLSAIVKLMYLFLADIQRNMFADEADSESSGGTLERQGRIRLGRNPRPATVGVFEVIATGTNGAILRAGLTFKSNEDSKSPGQLYIVDGEQEINGDPFTIRALGGGTDYDLVIDDKLTITEPVIGVDNTVTITGITTQPVSAESIELYRAQVIDSYQLEPQGGARTDYRLWAADAQGVQKVYPYVKNGDAGTTQVYVEATEADSIDGYGTPSDQLLEDVEDVIEFDPDDTRPLNERGRRPMGKVMEVLAIELVPIDVVITGLDDDSSDVQTAIESNLKIYLKNIRPYIAGADLLSNKKDVLYLSGLQSVVSESLNSGNFFTDFNMLADGVSVTTYTFTLGNIPYLRDVTYN